MLALFSKLMPRLVFKENVFDRLKNHAYNLRVQIKLREGSARPHFLFTNKRKIQTDRV